MKIAYIGKRFSDASMVLIVIADQIIKEYRAQGYTLTLRQLYYQLVARDEVENTQRSYKRVGSILNDARLAGLLDWEAIEDRTRNLQENSHWDSPAHIINTCARQYEIDKWEGQPRRVEVWVEKEALAGVLIGTCEELDVPFFACKGYTSQSEMWRAGRRLGQYEGSPLVIHLGDHDPSGIDMTRDIEDRLSMFAERSIEVRRIALNMDQVEEHEPPPNPAKLSDSRAQGYVMDHGYESWELDALEPKLLTGLVREHVARVLDPVLFQQRKDLEAEQRAALQRVADDWDEGDDR